MSETMHRRRSLLAAAAATLLALCGCVSTAAPGVDDRAYTSIWLIQPSEEVLGKRWVRSGDIVLKQRLLPPSLVRLRSDVVDTDSGKVVAEAGTELFGLLTRGPPIFCVAGVRDASAAVRFLLGGGNVQTCFIDMESDGDLDAHFGSGNQIHGLPNIEGRRPRNPDPTSGGDYERIAPEEMSHHYFVGLKYLGVPMLGRQPAFQIIYGDDRSTGGLTDSSGPRSGTEPLSLYPFGGEIVIEERQSGALLVDVRRGFQAQPFGVQQTVTYRVM